jgi:hypothetical protein
MRPFLLFRVRGGGGSQGIRETVYAHGEAVERDGGVESDDVVLVIESPPV